MGAELTQSLALGVGASGALVQIADSLVRYEAGVMHSEGRSDAFRPDTPPGTFTVTLDNYDGRFTPDNTAAAVAAGYSQALSEGSAACWSRGGKLWAGTVRGFEPSDEWGLVTLLCDDVLGAASRRKVLSIDEQLAGQQIAFWPLSDAAGSTAAVPATIDGVPAAPTLVVAAGTGGTQAFGAVSSLPYVGVSFTAGSSPSTSTPQLTSATGTNFLPFPSFYYPSGAVGTWGMWLVCSTAAARFLFQAVMATSNGSDLLTITISTSDGSSRASLGTTPSALVVGPSYTVGVPFYVAAQVTATFDGSGAVTYGLEYFVDGVSYGTATATPSTPVYRPAVIPSYITMFAATAAFGAPEGANATTIVSRLRYTLEAVNEALAIETTEAARIPSIAAASPEITLDTLPATLSTAPIGSQDTTQTVLDGLNDVINTEQGYIYTTTTGTLTAPTTVVTVRERTRPPSSTITSSNTFDAITEIRDRPRFLRDLTYTVESFTATGPNGNTVTYTDTTLIPRVGTASDSASVLNTESVDLYGWASDRVVRGANVGLRAVSVEIDSLTTPTDRTADLLALKQGDRIRIANIPSGPTGFTTWDGWIIGIKENHSATQSVFEFLVTPVLPDTAIYDTNRYMAGGNLSLGSTITTGATSISIVSADGTLFTTDGGDFPINIDIDSETLTLSAVSGTSSPQTGTVSARGVNGTTATSHTSGALLDLTTDSLYAF